MQRSFRKYHRFLALIVVLPLMLTVVTGMLTTMAESWSLNLGIPRSLLMKIHTGEIFHLGSIYPVLNGLGLLAMIVTGLSMSSLVKKRTTS